MKRKDLFKKLQIFTTLLATATALTACSLSIDSQTTGQKVEQYLETHQEDIKEVLQDLEAISGVDDREIKEITDQIQTIEDTIYEESNQTVSFQEATLVRVVDGDTLVVQIDGIENKVRLIGINTPESVAPPSYAKQNSEEGVKASEIVKDYLKNIDTVYLQKDVSETDKYGRLLRYVWLELPEDPLLKEEVQNKMLNGLLVGKITFPWKEPVAEPTTYVPDVQYSDTFNEIYNEALEEIEME